MQSYIKFVKGVDLASYRGGHTPSELIMADHGDVVVTYAPFEHINTSAELVLVGLTPGRTQAANALEALQSALSEGMSREASLERAKLEASFSGKMRNSLVAMLDFVGAPEKFGFQTAAAFFEPGSRMVHFTSALRYPVYLADGKDYSGTPKPLGHPELRRMVETHLAEEANVLRKALWVPLGAHAEASLTHLVDMGLLDARKVLCGLPHPSGANAERIAYFLKRKSRTSLSAKTNPEKIDTAREHIERQIAKLPGTMGSRSSVASEGRISPVSVNAF